MLIPVLATARLCAWPQHPEGGRALYLPLEEALARHWDTDAHTAAYSLPGVPRRLASGAPEAVGVPMVLALFDVDGPGHQATDAWWRAQQIPPECLAYRTRGGYRLVARLPEPVVIRCQDDAAAWSRLYLAWIAYLLTAHGIVADPACKDWTRLYRLPHATRDTAPEDLESTGTVGIWAPRVVVPPPPPRDAFREAICGSGTGTLYEAFRARGWVDRELSPGKWAVQCPWERDHTSGARFDSSTILRAPSAGKTLGWLHCSHSHCQGRTIHEVLAQFSQAELDVAAGIEILPNGWRARRA